MYRHLEPRSHSVIGLPGAIAATLTAILLVPPVSAAESSTAPVTPLYEGVGSHYSTPFANPMGIYFDPVKQECYVADTGNGQVVVFNDGGMPTYRFYHDVPGRNGEPVRGEPRALTVDTEGLIYLVDGRAPYIDVLDTRGRSIKHVFVPDDGCGQPERFMNVAIGPDRTIFAITACVKPRVAVLGPDATISRVIALQNSQEERACVTGFAVDRDACFVVTDACAPLMVQVYLADGTLSWAFGKHDTGFENFAFPAGVAVTGDRSLWIVDTIRQVVSRFDHEGKLLDMIGGKGSQPGAFEYPSAVATDGASRLFVLERQGNRYQCFQVNSESTAD